MKKNVTILIGLVVVISVLYAGSSFMKKGKSAVGMVEGEKTSLTMKPFNGQVVRVFEGDNVLEYGFDIPETATTSIDMDGALIKVTDVTVTGDVESTTTAPTVTTTPVVTFYMSYEGGRGYSPLDYINDIIAPHVSVMNPTSVTTIGSYDWQGAESEGSEWHIASVAGGKWLIVVENKKSTHDTVEKILESISVK
jgi:hypothetical protein